MIINQRLQWYLETENILAPEQSGVRLFHNTVAYLSQEVKDAFQKLVFATWKDLQKAFDKVWIYGFNVKHIWKLGFVD